MTEIERTGVLLFYKAPFCGMVFNEKTNTKTQR